MDAQRRTDVRGDGAHLSFRGSAGSTSRIHVIFNPASGRGRGERRIPVYLDLLRHYVGSVQHALTRAPGDEARLAQEAINNGAETVVAVGGDGTWGRVADQIVTSGAGVRLATFPSGTGNDFGRNLGLAYEGPKRAVRALVAGRVRRVDVGRVASASAPDELAGHADNYRARYFLNVVGFGFDVAVIDAAAGARFLRGAALYKLTAVQQLFRYPGIEPAVASASGAGHVGRHLIVTISNGRFFGGGFPIAPGASVDDGLLHACLIKDAGPFRRAMLLSRAERGHHVAEPEADLISDRCFTVRFPEAGPPCRFEIDGDVYVSSVPTVEVEVLRSALEVIVP
ncbi:MAG: diacylglycerol kinase family protein [Gemmatimonadota bacterium]|nr:diacylglycerol kinase family protein [Gemmatimonadota bacterium]